MSEDLSLKFEIDAGPAVAGVAKVEAATTELSGRLKTELTPATEAAFQAFQKLSTAEGPRAIQKGIIDAEKAMNGFKAAADKAAAAGAHMPAGISVAMKTMQADLDAGYLKLGRVRDQMGDVKTRADSMAQGFQQAANSGGSLNSMLSNLEARGGTAGALSRIGLAAGGMFAAFEVGMAIGEKIDKTLQSLGINLGKSALNLAGWAGALAKITSDPNHKKWLEELGNAQKNYNDLLTPLPGKMNEVMKAQQALARATQDADKDLKRLGLEWNTAGAAYDKAVKQIEAVSDRLDQATKSGENFDGIAKANAKTLQALEASMKDAGISTDSLTKEMQMLLATHDKLRDSEKTATELLRAEAAAQREVTAAVKEANAEFAAQEQFIKNRSAAIKDGTEVLDQYGNAIEKSKTQEAEWSAIWFTVTAATDAQKDALVELLKAQDAYNDSVAKTFDVAQGWADYLAQLVDAYHSGAASLIVYKRALEDFQTQLMQTFSGATGKAKDALEEMIRTIQRLIATAGQGGLPSGGASPTDQLNKAFG